MSSFLPFLLYGFFFALAMYLLYSFHTKWYWHVLSVILAIGIGLYPPPADWRGPGLDVVIGCLFVFFFFWGAGEIIFHTVGRHRIPHRI